MTDKEQLASLRETVRNISGVLAKLNNDRGLDDYIDVLRKAAQSPAERLAEKLYKAYHGPPPPVAPGAPLSAPVPPFDNDPRWIAVAEYVLATHRSTGGNIFAKGKDDQ